MLDVPQPRTASNDYTQDFSIEIPLEEPSANNHNEKSNDSLPTYRMDPEIDIHQCRECLICYICLILVVLCYSIFIIILYVWPEISKFTLVVNTDQGILNVYLGKKTGTIDVTTRSRCGIYPIVQTPLQ